MSTAVTSRIDPLTEGMWFYLRQLRGAWTLEGWDTFAGHSYPLPGRYRTQQSAIRAAHRELAKLEKSQPSETSGGQDGIQDQVYVVAPDGKRERIRGDTGRNA